MNKRIRYAFIFCSMVPVTVIASSPITGAQFDRLLEQAQFIIATWHGVLAALIFGLSMFLWRRIVRNEETSKNDIRNLDTYTRHEIRQLHGSIQSAFEHVLGQSRVFDERADRILEEARRLSDEIISMRERIARFEQEKASNK